MTAPIRTTALPAGPRVPVLGQGTWNMGDDSRQRASEAKALRLGLDLGMTLIDTAEMYAGGGAEEVVREAVTGRRDEAFIVSKVLPSNASRSGTIAACERSLKRLGTDRIDLYLLHWRGSFPLAETVQGMEALREQGKILHWGVSNFDTRDMEELAGLADGGGVQTNQVPYNLGRRGIEFELLPACKAKEVPVMAYSPVEQGALADDDRLATIAARHNATPAQIALAFVLAREGVIAIPKAATEAHVRENRGAHDIQLTDEDHAELDRLYPPPSRRGRLEMI